jgi:hypothetical protein
MVTIQSSIASCRERSRPQAPGFSSNDAILAYLMYPNLRIALHCFCLTSLIGNTPLSLRATFIQKSPCSSAALYYL